MKRLFVLLTLSLTLVRLSAQYATSPFVPAHFRATNVAVILPFNLASSSVEEDKQQMRSVEFYQGLLLAVNQAQLNGQHIDLQTYDLGTRPMEEILTDEHLLDANVIIAPMELNQVRQVALFGESHDIPVFSPFVFGRDMVEGFPHLFQLNTPKSVLYPQLCEAICAQFRNYQMVFVTDSLFQSQIDPFSSYLQTVLDQKGIAYHRYTYNEPYSVVCMDSALQLADKHVLYIPETSQQDALRRFFPSLKNKLFLDAHPAMAEAIGASYASGMNSASNSVTVEEVFPDSLLEADSVQFVTQERQVAILGYPEWQLYTGDFMDYYYDLNVWMFTKFYANPFDFEVTGVYNDFKYWYNRSLMPKLLPKFGLLGYDVAAYILNQTQMYGTLRGDHAEELPFYSLQTPMHFEQEGNGCFLNRSLYLVHFTPSTEIERVVIK